MEKNQVLKQKKKEKENLSETSERYHALNSIFEAESMIKSGYYEDAMVCLEKIDKKYLEGSFAVDDYEDLLKLAKENTKND